MSGTITTGTCSLKYWTMVGTTPATDGTSSTYSLPIGCSLTNVIGMFGIIIDSTNARVPIGQNGSIPDNGRASRFYVTSSGVTIEIGAGSSGLANKSLQITVVTNA